MSAECIARKRKIDNERNREMKEKRMMKEREGN
jgi:hypothetical protein